MFEKLDAIWELMAGRRLRYLSAIGVLVLASCFLYLAPLVPQIVIDGVLSGPDAEPSRFVAWAVEALGGRDWLAGNLWLPALLVVFLTCIAGLFTYLRGRWSASTSEAIVCDLRDRVYDHLQHLPCSYFDSAETGDIIQRCTSDVETVRTFLASHVVEVGRAMIMLLVPLPLLLMIDWRMAIVSVALLPVIVAFSYFYFRRIRTVFRAADEAEGRMTATIQENLTGIRVVRAFARQEYEKQKFGNVNGEHQQRDYRLYKLLASYWSISDILCHAQQLLVVGAGVYWLANGTLAPGAFFYFLSAVMMFLWPMRMMGRILADLGKAVVALERLQQILDEPTEDEVAAKAQDLPSLGDQEQPRELSGEIAFDVVTFSHGQSSPVLHGVSFNVPAGTSLGILGPSGCGKSTIVNLLLRLYEYEQGSILLDGIELRDLDRRFVRSQMAVVMQEPFLYSKTLRENLRLARPGAQDEEIFEATSIACVHESIEQFAHGYDTLVGERGVTLSGGQRQRVALARALLTDPAVLILDDALSAVDTNTESMILGALRQRKGRHTTILIAHRLSTVMHADRILVLDKGRVVQFGTHQELLEQDGLYARLWRIQNATETDEFIEGDEDALRETASGGRR